jgi:hypothetical protein
MKNTRHPNFILGIVSFILLIIGVGMRAYSYPSGDYIIGFSILLGAIHWIWSIVDVLKHYRIDSTRENRILWVILVIAIPPVGGVLYYALGRTVRV